ncbi:MAG: hypothetical protein QM791_07070 [Ferruginibacter sp.]
MKKQVLFMFTMMCSFFTASAQLPTSSGNIYKDTLQVNKSQVSKSALLPKTYVPYTMADIKGAKLPSVTNADGTVSTMSATEYLDKLNQMEKDLNSKGYSLRTGTRTANLTRTTVSYGTVKNVKVSSAALQSLAATPTVAYPSEAAQLSKVTTSAAAVVAYSDGSTPPAPNKPCVGAIQMMPSETKTASYNFTPVDLNFGDKSSLYAGIFAKYELKGKSEPLNGLCYWTATPASVTNAIKNTQSEFSFYVGAGAHIFVLNREFKIAEASISINTPSDPTKKLSKKELVMRIGKTIVDDVEEFSEDSKTLDRTDQESFSLTLADIVIPIAGPVSVRTTFKVGGSVGIRYLTSLNRYGLYAAVTPFAKSSANFEGAIDICSVAKAGVGGTLTIFDLQAPASVKSMLTWSSESWKLENVSDWTFKATFLKGRLYAFAEIDYYIDTKRWEVDFANLEGLNYTKTLININKTISFPNWNKDLAVKTLKAL